MQNSEFRIKNTKNKNQNVVKSFKQKAKSRKLLISYNAALSIELQALS